MPTPIPFDKPHLSLDAQIQQLADRGMYIEDKDRAGQMLARIGYYRLGFYWYDFESNHETHQLKLGTDFDHIVELYEFDRRLRLHILDAIDRVEVFARAQWAHHMSAVHGPFAHCQREIHTSNRLWLDNFTRTMESVKIKYEEPFINHFLEKYRNPTPPIWAVAEILSFGTLVRWYGCLEDERVKWRIRTAFNLPYPGLKSWMYHLNGVRNVCAHHARLWNRDFSQLKMQFPERLSPYKVEESKVYNTLLVLVDLLQTIDPGLNWKRRLIALMDGHKSVPESPMGFPEGWRNLKIWQ